jgi:hypothetical protein
MSSRSAVEDVLSLGLQLFLQLNSTETMEQVKAQVLYAADIASRLQSLTPVLQQYSQLVQTQTNVVTCYTHITTLCLQRQGRKDPHKSLRSSLRSSAQRVLVDVPRVLQLLQAFVDQGGAWTKTRQKTFDLFFLALTQHVTSLTHLLSLCTPDAVTHTTCTPAHMHSLQALVKANVQLAQRARNLSAALQATTGTDVRTVSVKLVNFVLRNIVDVLITLSTLFLTWLGPSAEEAYSTWYRTVLTATEAPEVRPSATDYLRYLLVPFSPHTTLGRTFDDIFRPPGTRTLNDPGGHLFLPFFKQIKQLVEETSKPLWVMVARQALFISDETEDNRDVAVHWLKQKATQVALAQLMQFAFTFLMMKLVKSGLHRVASVARAYVLEKMQRQARRLIAYYFHRPVSTKSKWEQLSDDMQKHRRSWLYPVLTLSEDADTFLGYECVTEGGTRRCATVHLTPGELPKGEYYDTLDECLSQCK